METGASELDVLDAASADAAEGATEQQPDGAQEASASKAPEPAACAQDIAKGTQEQEERGREQHQVDMTAELEGANHHEAQAHGAEQQSESLRHVCTPESQLQAVGGGRADEDETSGDVVTKGQGTPGAPDQAQAHDDTSPVHEAAPNAHQRALSNIGRGMSRPVSGAMSRPPSRPTSTAAPRSAAHSRPVSGRAR